MKAFLDTHVAVLLWRGDVGDFSPRAADLIERSALFVSPVVRLELAFLREIGRLTASADEILAALSSDCGVFQSDDPISTIVARAMDLDWTRDPFDRLLVATARLHRAPFLTRDARILEHFEAAIW